MEILLMVVALAVTHTFTYEAEVLPNRARPPWSFREVENCSVAIEDGVLHVRDDGTALGELQFISYPWMAIADRPHSVEARVRVASCSGPAGVILLAADGVREVGLTLFPDRIEIHRLEAVAEVDLADDFHVVRLEMAGDSAVVKVDGKVVLDLSGKSTWDAHAGRNLVGFGSLSSAATGEAWWDRVTWSAEQPEVEVYHDAHHHVVFKKEGVYACFPSLYQYENGALICSFGTRARRSHIDPTGGSMRMISRDGGVTWLECGDDVPYYNPAAVRADGNLAVTNAVGWQYVDESETDRLKAEGRTIRSVRPGTIAYLSGARSMVRTIGGDCVRPWSPIEVPPGGGMMNFNLRSSTSVNSVPAWSGAWKLRWKATRLPSFKPPPIRSRPRDRCPMPAQPRYRSQGGDWLIFRPVSGRKMCLSPWSERGTVPFSRTSPRKSGQSP